MASTKSLFKKQVAELTKKIKKINNGAVTEVEMNKLPKPVKRYLKYAHVIGSEHSKFIRLKFSGKTKLKPSDGWMPVNIEQITYITKPTRLAHITGSKWGVVGFSGFDKYETGKTEQTMKLLSFFAMSSPQGTGAASTAMVSFLSDMALFPSAFLSKYIEWENIDNLNAKATIKEPQLSVSAVLHFNEEGQLLSIESNDCYYSPDGSQLEKAKWSISYSAYEDKNGFMIPTEADENWTLKDGVFESGRYKLKSIELNKL